MSQCICVISKDGERLMPTLRPGRVRHLLNDGKAKIVKLASDRKGKYSKNPYNSVVEFQEAMANNDPCVEGVRLIAIAIVCRQILDDLGAISRYAESLIFFLGIFVSAYTQVFSPVLVAGIIVIVMFEINAASAGIADNLIECNSEQKD